jgi:hypothetical protein
LISWLRALLGIGSPKPTKYQVKPERGELRSKPKSGRDEIDGMNDGDYHSGIHGYSPNTAYPETQYGSGYDSQADWNDGDEH